MKTNYEYIRAWHAALLSGEHVQGMGQMEGYDKCGNVVRCCLGVLCRVLIGLGEDILVIDDHGVNRATGFGADADEGTLPVEAQIAMFGYSEASAETDWRDPGDPELQYPELQYTDPDPEGSGTDSAASLNDGGHTFKQIAGYIENTWPEAFAD